jgi:hypothetical protein
MDSSSRNFVIASPNDPDLGGPKKKHGEMTKAIRKISYESHLPLPIGSICMPYMVTFGV